MSKSARGQKRVLLWHWLSPTQGTSINVMPSSLTCMINWATHLRTVARRQALWRPSVELCPFCASPNPGNHILDTFPITDLVHWYLHIKLSLWLPEVVAQWKDCMPTPWGTWIQRGGVTYLLALRHPHTFPEEYVPLIVGKQGSCPKPPTRT